MEEERKKLEDMLNEGKKLIDEDVVKQSQVVDKYILKAMSEML